MVKLIVVWLFVIFCVPSFSIDNPDKPNYVDEFEKRYMNLLGELRVNESSSTLEFIEKNSKLISFLTEELDAAFKRLENDLSRESRYTLVKSQENWVRYLDSELLFIETHFNQMDFGSSRVIPPFITADQCI